MRELLNVDLNWVIFNYMVAKGLLDKGGNQGRLPGRDEKDRRGRSREETELSMSGTIGCLPTANSLFLVLAAKYLDTGIIQTFMEMRSSAPVSSLGVDI